MKEEIINKIKDIVNPYKDNGKLNDEDIFNIGADLMEIKGIIVKSIKSTNQYITIDYSYNNEDSFYTYIHEF